MAHINWKEEGNPFLNFTEEITYEWMEKGFDRKECKEWLDIGMKVTDAGFCSWLSYEVKVDALEVLNNLNRENSYQEEDLREQYEEHLEDDRFSEEVIEQLKNFPHKYSRPNLTSEQRLLIDKLITNQELKEKYKKNGLCKKCQQPNTRYDWCKPCKAKQFQKNFKNWTSNNLTVDEFIQKSQLKATDPHEVLEWIPYEQFTNTKYLASGGFGEVYKAEWNDEPIDYFWRRGMDNAKVALKSLNNSQNITLDFLTEIAHTKLVDGDYSVVSCYGISQDPQTGNYLMVMQYIKGGNLRQYLQQKVRELNWKDKLYKLSTIAEGLYLIHRQSLVHRDFHPGNILNDNTSNYNDNYDHALSYITDLGLSWPANEEKRINKIFGVLPYVAPEVLYSKPYTQAADVYSFSIIAYEFLANSYPYSDLGDTSLALAICRGLRPNLEEIKIPKLLKDLINQCWDAEPLKRLTASELYKILKRWNDEIDLRRDTEFTRQVQEIEVEYNQISLNTPYQIHPQVIYTSRLLDFKNLPEPQNSKEINEQFWNSKQNNISQSIEFPMTELQKTLEEQIEDQVEYKTQNQIEFLPKRSN